MLLPSSWMLISGTLLSTSPPGVTTKSRLGSEGGGGVGIASQETQHWSQLYSSSSWKQTQDTVYHLSSQIKKNWHRIISGPGGLQLTIQNQTLSEWTTFQQE